MTSRMRLLIAVPVLAALSAAPLASAHADWHRGYGGHGYYGGGYNRGPGVGGVVAGALLGLGAAAVVGSIIAPPVVYRAPPVVYAPPPVYYAAPPPVVYAAPPSYPPPGYYPN